MKRAGVVVAVLAAVLVTGAVPVPAQPASSPPVVRIGYIDVSRVLARSAAGVAAREQLEREKATMQREMDGRRQELEREKATMQREMDGRRQELEKMREELEKKGALMAADARREREDQLERKRRDAARLADDFQRELGRKEQQLAQKVLADLSTVIERLGKQKGYYLIVERRGAGVLYSSPEADLTDEVIRAYDQEAAAKGKK